MKKQKDPKAKPSTGDKLTAAIDSISLERTQLTMEEAKSITDKFECSLKQLSDCNKSEIDYIVNLFNLYAASGAKFHPSKDFNLIFK